MKANELKLLSQAGADTCILADSGAETGRIPFSVAALALRSGVDLLDNMDVIRFKELHNEMRKELQDNDCGNWSAEAREWAISTGLITGNGTKINGEPNYMWADTLSREQLVTVLYRFAKMMGIGLI